MPWSAGLVGWPAVFAATAAFSLAFLTNHRWLGFVGAGIAAPFCLFAGGYPLFHWAAPVALAGNILAAYLVYRGRPDVAFALLLPFILIVTVLAVFALRGITLPASTLATNPGTRYYRNMIPSAAPGRALPKLVARWAIFAMLTTVSPGAAQTFRSGVNLVILPVTVTNTDGRFVGALTQRDFSVFEDDHQRPIEQFSAERVPVSLGILIDISGSMLGARFADARIALGKLLERLQRDDRVFLAVFNDTFRMVLPWTNDHGAVTDALARVVPRGGTSLYSALTTALPVLNAGPNQKKALVLISDGADNSMPGGIVNRTGLESAVRHALESEALIYAVGIGKPMPPIDEFLRQDAAARLQMAYDPPVDLELLQQLTDPTGGYSQLVASSANLSSTVIQIADDLSAQYVIGFESMQPLDGKSHTLKVTVANPGLRVRSRSEYVAAPTTR